MKDSLTTLEFPKIQRELASYCKGERAKDTVSSLAPYQNKHFLLDELKRLEEGMLLYEQYGSLPLSPSPNLSSFLLLAKKGGSLKGEVLVAILQDIHQGKDIVHFLKGKEQNFPYLNEKCSFFLPFTNLERLLTKSLKEDGSLKDEASTRLSSLRRRKKLIQSSMRSLAESLLEKYSEYLASYSLTLRNGHYVLPIQNAYKSKVRGFLQGISQTGGTLFVEPEELLTQEQKLMELLQEEKEEEERILAFLSQEVGKEKESLEEENIAIGYFDFLNAKILFASSYQGIVPIVKDTQGIHFIKARHPLLSKEQIVANDFIFDEKRRIYLLSGPNAGGKTVALKTVGLLSLMALSGLAIPVREGGSLSFFPHVYADIGDNQSLEENLSTFSAHMKQVGEIVDKVTKDDLVLLDELGTGTSPNEGEALAESVFSYLLKKNCLAMISSHFEGLKSYALSQDGALNASMAFDQESLKPTYRLRIGVPGESYGLLVAERFGLPKEIIQLATNFEEKHKEGSLTKAIAKLEEETKRAEEKEKLLEGKEEEWEEKKKVLASKEAALLLKEKDFQEDLKKKKKALLQKYEEQLEALLKEASSINKLHEAIALRKRMHALGEEKERIEEEIHEENLKVGDYVSSPSFFFEGRILSLGKDYALIGEKGAKSMRLPLSSLKRKAPPKKEKEVMETSRPLDELIQYKNVKSELYLLGMRAEEAKLALEEYLDACRMGKINRVRIIHGYGSGVLKNVVHGYLAAHPEFVSSFASAGPEEGGGGATIVLLKTR